MIDRIRDWLARAAGAVRLRQLADRVRHRLSFVPMLYVIFAFLLVEILLIVDRSLAGEELPELFTTTVNSARSVFTAIAGGLITSITLLLSMMLVTIQLASSQFSPRTLRDWLGNRTLQHSIGLVLGTTVFSLLALRSTRNFEESGSALVPHTTVLVAVVLGIASLIAVVRSVDHITQSLRIGNVADRIAQDTIGVIRSVGELRAGQAPSIAPSGVDRTILESHDVPNDAFAVEARSSGWLQQIDESTILRALPDGSTAYIVGTIGGFAHAGSPLVWVSPGPEDEDTCASGMLEGFAIGDSRTMQQDVAFGIIQLTDIAVRALSPGINDPSTATDVIVQLGDVLLTIWEQPPASGTREEDGRTIVRHEPDHAELLERAFGPIRRYGRADADVIAALLRTLRTLRTETTRRGLPGPVEPIDAAIADIARFSERMAWTGQETRMVAELAESG